MFKLTNLKNFIITYKKKIVIFIISIFVAVLLLFISLSYYQQKQAEKIIAIPLGSTLGVKIFHQSKYKRQFWQLVRYFITQANPAYCSVASAVMVLNALKIYPPQDDMTYHSLHMFTQKNFFTPKVLKILPPDKIKKRGSTLDQLGAAIKTFPVFVDIVHTKQTSMEKFRQLAISAVNSNNTYIILEYSVYEIYGVLTGHFSPIAAYDKKTDRFLVMDVFRIGHPPVWIKTKDLWHAMQKVDPTDGKDRGFLVLFFA